SLRAISRHAMLGRGSDVPEPRLRPPTAGRLEECSRQPKDGRTGDTKPRNHEEYLLKESFLVSCFCAHGCDTSRDAATKSPNVEINQDRDDDVDRSAIQATRLEMPLACGSDSLAIESVRIKGPCDTNVRWNSVGAHDQLQHHAAFNPIEHGPIGIGGFDFKDH